MNVVKVAIVGAGFSGMGAAIKLQQNGFEDFLIIDRGVDFGGTWRDNTYPGAACDVPSHLYSYSFELNPNWSRSFSKQAEIHAYINEVAAKYALARRTRFRTEVTHAEWDSAAGVWVIDVTHPDTGSAQVRAEILVGAIGPLCEPKLPDIEGIDSYRGQIFHSARWDHESDVTGKRVAVIGTGASAVQIIPELAPTVGHLDVYQRTAPWVLPRADRPYTAAEHWLFRNVPGAQRLSRSAIYWSHELVSFGLTYRPNALRPAQWAGALNIRRGISDPVKRAKVTPSFSVGCKRMLLSNTYYPALGRDNVDVVTDPIAKVTATGIVTRDGAHREVDAIVVATGFHVTDSPGFDHIVGREGKSLAQVWATDGMKAYKGAMVHGFPNMFLMIGPSTGLGHTSMVFMIESQLNYLVDYLRTVTSEQITRTEVRAERQRDYNERIQQTLGTSVWENGGCASWYKDSFGNITTLWPGFTFNFRRATRSFDLDAYDTARGSDRITIGATTA
ncbi:NAD(P)/FAD-dependent oxidoreductase [Williamsia sp. CHRR-6]|uniref:flavin-containing monooxygenase n=1 Tax=Williamsia sp. CHRR-6 TaxID=2835871 RepID=UPI001BDA8DF1|nr:NAD(P)/FAD-dependent oxidoreductase [Williamsia sp. CHRR-6]MBT0568452.1 NAD(P)/FAD-dependent oxidoreductase [Williamsia sp. CHRR-6]